MYVKLFSSILESSVWDEAPATRLVWITFLLLADEEGFVKGVESGIARRACVSKQECRVALEVLSAPDIESQDQDHGGRRLEKVEGGWVVLNYKKYREIRTKKQEREAAKKRRQRDRKAAAEAAEEGGDMSPLSPPYASASASPVVRSSTRARENGVLDPALVGWLHYEAAHPHPDAFDAAVGEAVTAHGWRAVAEGFREMRTNAQPFTARRLLGYAKVAARRAAPPVSQYPPAVAVAPAWCATCGEGELTTPEGQKRPVRVHAATCPQRIA